MSSLSYKHSHFLNISLKHLFLAEKEFAKLSNLIYDRKFINWFKLIKPIYQYLLKNYYEKYSECYENVDISICMSAFALEAFINFYAVHYGLDKIPGYNERNSAEEKWKKYPKQRTGTSLSQETIKMVKKVIDDRNNIAHYKPSSNTDVINAHSLKTAYENVNNVYKIYNEINKIDINVNLPVYKVEIPKNAENIVLEYVAVCNMTWKDSK